MRHWMIWPTFVAGIALTSLSGGAWLAYSALSDPSFAVEPDYYAKAVRWDERTRQAAQNKRLGWTLSVTNAVRGRLDVRVLDRMGDTIEGATISAVAFANARASDRIDLTFQSEPDGGYSAEFHPGRNGNWRFRFVINAEAERFTSEFDQLLIGVPLPGGTP